MISVGPCIAASEAQEQRAVIQWWGWLCGRLGAPESALLHIPNEGTQSTVRGRQQKMLGVRKGCPDLFLCVARGGHHGLWIEMKRRRGGRVSPEQATFMEQLREQGYACEVCRGADDACKAITAYMRLGRE